MKEEIKYQDWPEMVKITTALSNKRLLITNHKVPLILGYIVLVIGLIYLVDLIAQGSLTDITGLFPPLGYVIIGVFNIGGSYSLKWITHHSSWEERFENTSTTSHKLIGFVFIAIALFSLYLIFNFE